MEKHEPNALSPGGEAARTGKTSPVISHLKILKHSLKIKRFKIDVFKYSSKTWKRSATAPICWKTASQVQKPATYSDTPFTTGIFK